MNWYGLLILGCIGLIVGCGPSKNEFETLQQEVDLLKSMLDIEEMVVSAQKVQIVDGTGKERAVFSTTLPVEGYPYVSPILTFLDDSGQKRVYLMYSEEADAGLFGWDNPEKPLDPHQIRVDELMRRP